MWGDVGSEPAVRSLGCWATSCSHLLATGSPLSQCEDSGQCTAREGRGGVLWFEVIGDQQKQGQLKDDTSVERGFLLLFKLYWKTDCSRLAPEFGCCWILNAVGYHLNFVAAVI